MSFEDTVRSELERAGAMVPVAGVDLNRVVTRGRSIRRRKMAAMVATTAALIAVAVGGGVLFTSSSRTGLGPGPAGDPSRSATPTESVSPTPEDDASKPSYDMVEPVLGEWLTAIQESDEDRAWALMTPEAQAEVGQSAFDQMMGSALPEGLGGFADAEAFHYIVVSSGPDQARVLGVVSGQVTREATTEFAAMAIPMRVQGEETLVDDPIVDRPHYYERQAVFASVSAGPLSFHSGDDLTVEFADPRGASDVSIAVDDDRRPLPTEFDPERGLAVATLDRDLQEGRHIATVIVHHESGRLYAEAIVFQAAAP